MRLAALSTDADGRTGADAGGAGAGVRCGKLSGIVGVFGRVLSALALVSFGVRISWIETSSRSGTKEGADAVSANARQLLDNTIRPHPSRSRLNV